DITLGKSPPPANEVDISKGEEK
ncbi:hypothetical protein LCGC14_2208300, partial [marine sediment metagenome]